MRPIQIERTAEDHFLVYVPLQANRNQNVAYRARARNVATIERRCGLWLWWTHDGRAIDLCETYEEAEDGVRAALREAGEFVPPSRRELVAYLRDWSRSSGVDVSGFDPWAFIDFYEASGWTVSKGKPMRDWQAAVRDWARRGATVA